MDLCRKEGNNIILLWFTIIRESNSVQDENDEMWIIDYIRNDYGKVKMTSCLFILLYWCLDHSP